MTTAPVRAAAAERRRRRTFLGLGSALLAVGLVILGYLAWQLIGTNVISERRQDALVEQLQERWGTPSGAGATVTSGEAGALVRIPRFGDDYVVPVLEGVGDDQLSSGFGHVEESAAPGQAGNYALAGHRITHGEPLRDLPSLRPGDTVLVETGDAIFTYEVDTEPGDLVVDLDADWVLDARPVNPDAAGVQPAAAPELLTLVTCAELFHTDDRMVVFGHLVGVQTK